MLVGLSGTLKHTDKQHIVHTALSAQFKCLFCVPD